MIENKTIKKDETIISDDIELCKDLSIVLVSSPSPSNPSTSMLESVIDSFNMITNLDQCSKIYIMLDGYEIWPEAKTKSGRITEEMSILYEKYKENVISKYHGNQKFVVVNCSNHCGFAMAVKKGLELSKTTYCLIAQHDRSFVCKFDNLHSILGHIKRDETIRYIGFPTVTSMNHNSALLSRYNLKILSGFDITKRILIGDNINNTIDNNENDELMLHPYLQPLIFWFDSQHICHKERYLEIYKPFSYMPVELRDKMGYHNIKKMVLRIGDFIEDRFGQQQRQFLKSLSDDKDKEILLKAFTWFGSYLYFIPCIQEDDPRHKYDLKSKILVGHLRGRQSRSDSHLEDVISVFENSELIIEK